MNAFPMPNLLPAYAEIFLLAAACVILVVDLFLDDERRYVTYALSLVTLAVCAFLTAGIGAISEPQYTFNGMFVSDVMGNVLKMLTYVAVGAGMVYSRTYLAERGLLKGEYFTLALFATLGMMVMISANNFLTLYIGLELLSLCQYAMVALNRDSAKSTEAAMKYFVLGALASGLLLYGMSMIYGATGSLEITTIARTLEISHPSRTVLVFGLVFIVSGLAFKLGVVPFHMWIPDVYDGAANAVALFIATAPKLAAFAMTMRLLVNALLSLAVDWQEMLILLAVLSMAIGNLAAIAQTNIKRMLAYSTISHMGFMLLGMLSGVVGGNWLSAPDAYSAAMFYSMVYVISSLAAFGMVLLLSRAGFEAENIEDFRGLNRRSPWFAFIMLITMFSLAGIPPTAGFYAKLAVLQSTVAAGMIWLAVVAVIFSLIGAFYYLRIVKLMYFDEPAGTSGASGTAGAAGDVLVLSPRTDMCILLSVNGLALLVLGILPERLMALCYFAIKSL
jgi:NADH-quinone oxidoreductase subunit N